MSSSPTDQLVEVQMPQMGVSVAEGTIVEWRKRPGDWVESDEPICDITTDKIDVEVPSPSSGRVERILVEPGKTVSVGTPLAEINPGAKAGEAHPEESAVSSQQSAEAEPGPDVPDTSNGEADRSRFYSPVVRRIADKHGVDLSRVEGTGVGGRVRKRDVLAFIESGDAERAEPKPEPTLHMESPYRPEEAELAPAAPKPETEVFSPQRREPMSPMRHQIARHMVESRRTSAHCTTIVETDMSAVARRRAELKPDFERRGIPLTYLAFVARATVTELQRYPILNASIDGEEIVHHDDVNLGIAVALEDGLIVPVIRQAQQLSLEGTAAAIADVARRARAKQLQPDEVHGGTFTITNPGQFGAVLATPIINQPQVAILDLEAIVKRPVVVESEDGDSIAIRPMTYLCMSWDHRALDGAVAARFLATVKGRLESCEVT
ncbi:MAG TPA: dihydrolipoamide acetyltransferase family protein [Solirubrobacterales bacterium]|nr:dihydrolipoamide acetyltransferase family protein [Solirubrobacterales bacterium]